MQRLQELKTIAGKCLEEKDFLGRTKKHAGRTDATKDFYKKLIEISDTDLTNVKELEKHINAFKVSIAKEAQEKMVNKLKK